VHSLLLSCERLARWPSSEFLFESSVRFPFSLMKRLVICTAFEWEIK
jgi:hypothetical protein